MENMDNNQLANTMETSMVLQKLYTTFSLNFDLDLVHSYQEATQQNIENVLELEMRQIKRKHFEEEESFVDRMLLANPIANERRAITQQANKEEIKDLNQLQRAESCRKSRMNNKIKKAKLRYRHKFVSAKLINSSNVLNCIREIIAKSEHKLIANGFDPKIILNLRTNTGVDRNNGFIKDYKTPEHNQIAAPTYRT